MPDDKPTADLRELRWIRFALYALIAPLLFLIAILLGLHLWFEYLSVRHPGHPAGPALRGERVFRKIVSGGQTGVDQAALRVALALKLECGGWCPPNRECDGKLEGEIGTIPAEFPLQETPRNTSPLAPEVKRSQRTEWNVRDSDATLFILKPEGKPEAIDDPGTKWTLEAARLYNRPVWFVNMCKDCDESRLDIEATKVVVWARARKVQVLNVAGPSERSCAGIGKWTENFLKRVLTIDQP
jgi:hypothetical protein